MKCEKRKLRKYCSPRELSTVILFLTGGVLFRRRYWPSWALCIYCLT